jgi:hypothetical protein
MEMIAQLSGFQKVDIDSIGRDRIFSNRKDFKYLFGRDELNEVLSIMKKDYELMNVEGALQHDYQTHCFDTQDLKDSVILTVYHERP